MSRGEGFAGRPVVWLNGAFGVGKTSVAAELARRRPTITFDPEVIGGGLWRMLPEDMLPDDYQDSALWRHLVREAVVALHRAYSRPVIVPMTLVVPEYFDEIVGGLRAQGVPVWHYVLAAARETIEERLAGRPDTTDWTWWQVDRCLVALQDRRFRLVVATDGQTIEEVADAIEADAYETAEAVPA